mgnify:CR=1 FL=1
MFKILTLSSEISHSFDTVIVSEVTMNSIKSFWQNTETSLAQRYLDALSVIKRLQRLQLDVIKDEFERLSVLEINAVQALLLFNTGKTK